MDSKLRIAVIGHVKRSGGPSPPAPPGPPSSPTGVGRLGSPPTQPAPTSPSAVGRGSPAPPPRATAADRGRRASPAPPPRATAADRGDRGSPPPPPRAAAAAAAADRGGRGSPPPPPRGTAADRGGRGSPPRTDVAYPVFISWGHKKKPNGGRRRPRPIGCIYPKYQPPKTRGRPRPDPIPVMRRRGVEAVLVGSKFVTPKKALTGNLKIDEANDVLCGLYGALYESVSILEKQCDVNPDQGQSSLKSNIIDLRTRAFLIRRIVLASGYRPVNEPLLFKGLCPR